MSDVLGEMPTPVCDQGCVRAPGGRDAAPYAEDLSSPRSEPPLPTGTPSPEVPGV